MPDLLIARWAKGYVKTGTLGGEESYISLSSYTDPQSAASAAAVILSENNDVEANVSMSAKIEPRNGNDEPARTVKTGDGAYFPTMNRDLAKVRVLQWTMGEDQNAKATWAMGVNSLAADRAEREARQVAAMLPGGFNGVSDSVTNAQDLGPGIPSGVLPGSVICNYSSGDVVQVDVAPPVIFTSPGRVFRILLGCKVAPVGGDIHGALYLNGVLVDGGVNIPEGSLGPIDHFVNLPYTSLDVLVFAVVDPIPIAGGLSAAVYATSRV